MRRAAIDSGTQVLKIILVGASRSHCVHGLHCDDLLTCQTSLSTGRKPAEHTADRQSYSPYAVCLAFGLDALRREAVLVGGIAGR
jgi:hypothetical protein